MGGAGADVRQRPMLARLDRLQLTPGTLQIGRQQFVEFADDDQGHVVRRIPGLAHLLQLLLGQMADFGALRAFQSQLDSQLIARGMTEVLTVEETLQPGVVPAVLTLDHPLGGVDSIVVDACLGQQRQQQVEHLALVFRRGFDDERGVGIAGERVPVTTQRLHALFQTAFASGIDAAEQQVFEQMRQLFLVAIEVIQANADHQPDRHMATFGAGFEHQLQTVGQRIAFDLKPIQGKSGQGTEQQTGEQQATHNRLPYG